MNSPPHTQARPSSVHDPAFEELVADVKAGNAEAMGELWEVVRRFVVMRAEQRAYLPGCRVPAEDFIQAGFFAMLDAACQYVPGRGHNYLKTLDFALQKRFAEEQGVRSSKRETLLFFADSMDTPAMMDNPEGPTVAETIEDEAAALPFLNVEYADFMLYCRGTIKATLSSVNKTQAEVIRAHYFGGQSLRDIAEQRGTAHQAVAAIEQDAFYKIMRGKYSRLLRECLDTFDDFHNAEEITEYIARPTEAAAMKTSGSAAS